MAGQGRGNEAFRAARAELAQEKLVEELIAVGRRLHREGRLRRSYDLTLRQLRRWESGQTVWPRKDSRIVLEEYFGRAVGELGFVSPLNASAERTETIPPPHPRKWVIVRTAAALWPHWEPRRHCLRWSRRPYGPSAAG
ncbi:hypothetical protein SAMN05421773_1114 [Streptomyces aidingensis]|uniref:HTH cro/C1-type domain-containing protein n=1 Tax=Streptomyces aidingensis TaxID=910347 RepID=A0A1I1QBC4_9ACTN|nr:hypothetical protein SAMN05421773_1114 [Streptomyces aidingensis]